MNFDTPTYIEVELEELRVSSGATTAVVNVIRSGEFRLYTKVGFATADGSAVANEDYKASGGTLVFKPGEGYKSIEIPLLSGGAAGQERTFELRLSAESPNTEILNETVSVILEPAHLSGASLPELKIAPAPDGAVKLTWTFAENLVLERTNRLSGSWAMFPCEIAIENGTCKVFERCDGEFFFYRLRAE